ncbi:futalosine hydrolase [Mucilaginibacter myungsuensis]|uniref:Futalosine hydrolase n=1 Tax=Mucilaginibacter myungsuensis TaxID=649104 RepID=A0A929PW33_9SPHI|nr:futalosine hydrolase [Mucilaginibacter myungsuensis]MBE9661656.1 futalosine hydrolase [Mucilaginibacter myungsuensis]MDN3597800.1 futalosine hydrolase [Mucilaginibacter myungsuensis]
MKILIVAATQQEIEPLFSVESLKSQVESNSSNLDLQTTDLLITGVGMVATAFSLGRHLATNQYDLAINLGIAGSFDRSLDLGEVVEITSDTFSELGAEDGEKFLTIKDLCLGDHIYSASTTVSNLLSPIPPEENKLLVKQVAGITVNCVHGNDISISKIKDRLRPQVESMEGAAFFYACKLAGLPCIQIRSVSNYVEKRNRDAWQIGLAVKNLNTFADALLQKLS